MTVGDTEPVGRARAAQLRVSGRPPPSAMVVALLEDDPADADLLIRLLTKGWPEPVNVITFCTVGELTAELEELAPDLVLCDLSVPDGQGMEVVERVVATAGSAPIVVLTQSNDSEIPVLALKAGAQDYLLKNSIDGESLARSLRYAMARRAAALENTRIERNLGQLQRELNRYAGIIAHDLRSPVRTARLFAERLVATTEGTQERPDIAVALDSSLERLEFMIGRLQRIATLRDTVLRPEANLLSLVVDSVSQELRTELEVDGLSLAVTADGEFVADQPLIRQVLRELFRNSITHRSMVRDLQISIEVENTSTTSKVTVSDNGIGIEPQYRERVFRLFERLSPVESTGLGFGLAFCTQAAEMHGGSIEAVEPIEPWKTTIQLLLPRTTDQSI